MTGVFLKQKQEKQVSRGNELYYFTVMNSKYYAFSGTTEHCYHEHKGQNK